MRINDKRGFTLIEVIVVAGIIAILAGILVPMIFNQVEEAKISRAQADMKSIHSAIMLAKKDTGSWPDKSAPGVASVSMLYSDTPSFAITATAPGTNWDANSAQRLLSHLKTDDNSAYGTLFKGPYLVTAEADPWGNAYIINADMFKVDGGKVWIVSAGPDGIVQTNVMLETCTDKASGAPADAADICLRIK